MCQPKLYLLIEGLPEFSEEAYSAMVARYGKHTIGTYKYAHETRNLIDEMIRGGPLPAGAHPLFGMRPEDVERGHGSRLIIGELKADIEWMTRGFPVRNGWDPENASRCVYTPYEMGT